MFQIDNIAIAANDRFGLISRPIVNYADFFVPCCYYAINHASNTSRLVVRSYEKADVAWVYFFDFHTCF